MHTRASDRIDGAGPFLETYGGMTVVLQVHPDGSVADARGQWQLRCIDPAHAGEVKSEFTRSVSQAMAATKPGLIYRGVAVSKLRSTSESVQLRFTEQDPAGVLLRAVLESSPAPGAVPAPSAAAVPMVRPFRGTILGNSYRSDRRPIRLRSDDADRVARAGQASPVGVNTTNDTLTIALAVDGTRLVGEDKFFTYQFEPAAAAAVETRVQGPETRDQGQETMDRRQVTIGGSRETRDKRQPESPREASAEPEPAAAATTLIGVQRPATRDRGQEAVQRRQVTVDGSPPAEPKTPNPEPETGAAAVAPAAAYPAATGAYVMVNGRWVPLPKANSHVVQTVVQRLNASLTKLRQVEDAAVGMRSDPSNTLVGTLTLDGKEAPPVVPSKDVVVAYVGALPTLPAEDPGTLPCAAKLPRHRIGARDASAQRSPAGAAFPDRSRVFRLWPRQDRRDPRASQRERHPSPLSYPPLPRPLRLHLRLASLRAPNRVAGAAFSCPSMRRCRWSPSTIS